MGFTVDGVVSVPEQESATSMQPQEVLAECVEYCALSRSGWSAEPDDIVAGIWSSERNEEV